jgi:hypothetical protein
MQVYGGYYRKLSKKVQTELAAANSVAEEVLGSVTTVMAHAAQDSAAAAYAAKLQSFYSIQKKEALAYSLYATTSVFLPNLVAAVVLFYGGSLVLSGGQLWAGCGSLGWPRCFAAGCAKLDRRCCGLAGAERRALPQLLSSRACPPCHNHLDHPAGHMSPGALVSFMLYQQSLSSAFTMMGDVFSALAAAVGAADKVIELMNRRPEVCQPGSFVPQEFRGGRLHQHRPRQQLKRGCIAAALLVIKPVAHLPTAFHPTPTPHPHTHRRAGAAGCGLQLPQPPGGARAERPVAGGAAGRGGGAGGPQRWGQVVHHQAAGALLPAGLGPGGRLGARGAGREARGCDEPTSAAARQRACAHRQPAPPPAQVLVDGRDVGFYDPKWLRRRVRQARPSRAAALRPSRRRVHKKRAWAAAAAAAAACRWRWLPRSLCCTRAPSRGGRAVLTCPGQARPGCQAAAL